MTDPIHMSFDGEWAQLIRRMGAQISKNPEETVAFALRHLDTVLNLAPGEPIVIRKKETEISVEKIVGDADTCVNCGHAGRDHISTGCLGTPLIPCSCRDFLPGDGG